MVVVVLGIEPRALCMLGKHFTTELSYNPSFCFFLLRQDLTKLSRQTLNLETSCLNLRGITGLCCQAPLLTILENIGSISQT